LPNNSGSLKKIYQRQQYCPNYNVKLLFSQLQIKKIYSGLRDIPHQQTNHNKPQIYETNKITRHEQFTGSAEQAERGETLICDSHRSAHRCNRKPDTR
jgi:hypothetical protein